jgi:hypothetical protein
MLRLIIPITVAMAIPGAVSAQLGPEHPADGFFSAEPVRVADVASHCATEIEPGPNDVVTYSTCALAEIDTLVGGPSEVVLAARYVRWIRSSDVDWVDSLQVDEVVLFETLNDDPTLATPVWHRVGYHNFLSLLDWAEYDGVHLLQLYNCVRGTGGCVEDLLLRDDTGWVALELTFVAELGAHVPADYQLHKGRRIDLSTLRFEQPISRPEDANCCPSARLIGALRLEGQRLRLEAVQLARQLRDD